MLLVLGAVGTICLSCLDDDALRPRWRPVDVQVEQAIPDGCARFQVQANPGQNATVDSIYGTQYCQTNELKLIQDSAAVFDAATGTLKVPIVVKNVGTRAVRGLLKIRYDADSVQLFDASGNRVPGPTTIVGLGDSTLNNGRVAYWAYNQLLAPAGKLQVLFAGQTSGRRLLEFRGADWGNAVRMKLFTTAKYETVPASAPDGFPNTLHDSANVDWAPASGEPPFVREHLFVLFDSTSSQATRQAAVDAIGGAVVGGGLGGAAYMVRIGRDSTGQRLNQAIQLMRLQAGVLKVAKEYLLGIRPTFMKPSDGSGWRRIDWHVDTVGTSDTTWGLEQLRFPKAWGCETGDPALRIAVLDKGFSLSKLGDLAPNVGDTTHVNVDSIAFHGGLVASTLGARGNNSIGITGAVWNTRLDLRDVSLLDSATGRAKRNDNTGEWRSEFLRHFGNAISNRDRLVNISMGADSTPVFSVADPIRDSVYRDFVGWLKLLADTANPSGPVLLVSAGNVQNGDPRESVFPMLLDSLPKRTIAVRAMDRVGNLVNAVAAVGRPYVTFAAPGRNVAALGPGNSTVFVTGSSIATPLVSGVAALALSFAHDLPSDSLKYYLELGADSGNRFTPADHIRVPNAYETLKALVRRRGGPLCGNRVFIKSDSLLTVERLSDNPSSDDTIGTWNSGWPVLFVEHGGKSIANGYLTGSNVHFVFSDATASWQKLAGSGTENNSPFFLSHAGLSHDRDTMLVFVPVPVANRTAIRYFLADSLGNPLPGPSVTVPLGGVNGAHVQAYDLSRPRVFFAPLADPSRPIYEIDLVAGTYSTLPLSYSLNHVEWLGVSEDGAELRILDRDRAANTCNIDFVSLRPGDKGTRRRRISGPTRWLNGPCGVDGGFAPRIATPFGMRAPTLPGTAASPH